VVSSYEVLDDEHQAWGRGCRWTVPITRKFSALYSGVITPRSRQLFLVMRRASAQALGLKPRCCDAGAGVLCGVGRLYVHHAIRKGRV